MFLLVHWLNSMPCRGSFRLDRSTSGRLLRYHNARSKCRRRDQRESRRRGGRRGGGGRTEGERERGRGDSANKGNKGQTGGILDGEAGWRGTRAGLERNGKGDLLVVPVSAGSGLTEVTDRTEGTGTWSRSRQNPAPGTRFRARARASLAMPRPLPWPNPVLTLS